MTTRVYCISGQNSVNLVKEFYNGLQQRLKNRSPHDIANIHIYCATTRLREQLKALFVKNGGFLPKLYTLDDIELGARVRESSIYHKLGPVQQYLLLARLIKSFLENNPHLDHTTSVFSFTDSLIELMDTFYYNGLPLTDLLTATDPLQTPYYEDVYRFLSILSQVWPDILSERNLVHHQAQLFTDLQANNVSLHHKCDKTSVIAFGYTGRHALERLFLRTVTTHCHPDSAVIIPGYDRLLDARAWDNLIPDHNQFHIKLTLETLECPRNNVQDWHDTKDTVVHTARDILVSQAFCPPPVTDSWYAQKQPLQQIALPATQNITLIQAGTVQEEAIAIAVRLREVLATPKQTAIVVSADNTLSRYIQMELSRWNIIIDDAAGRPLSLTPPGILSDLVLDVVSKPFDLVRILSLLKHPLCVLSQDGTRADHIKHVRRLEANLRENRDPLSLPPIDWKTFCKMDHILCANLHTALKPLLDMVEHDCSSLNMHLAAHAQVMHNIGKDVFEKDAGETLLTFFEETTKHADDYGNIEFGEYPVLYAALLRHYHVRVAETGHPRLMILNPKEVYAQHADVLIFSGLNEDTFPQLPKIGAWLGRNMRDQIGLPAIEEQVGENAFSLYWAMLHPQLVLTRAQRQDNAPTVCSRWLFRLISLLQGIAPQALKDMQQRGARYVAYADDVAKHHHEHDDLGACMRPFPTPPLAARPRCISATQVKQLILNPYTIYARHVLGLYSIADLQHPVNHQFTGTFIHKILEDTLRDLDTQDWAQAATRFDAVFTKHAQDTLERLDSFPMEKIFLENRIAHIKAWVCQTEEHRRRHARPVALEHKGTMTLQTTLGTVTLTAEADRIDLTNDGAAIIYDYKTGATIPTSKDIEHYDKQLLIEAGIVTAGGFTPKVAAVPVHKTAYLQLRSLKDSIEKDHVFSAQDIQDCLDGIVKLFNAYADPAQGYGAQMRPVQTSYTDTYDHLARVGEWTYTV